MIFLIKTVHPIFYRGELNKYIALKSQAFSPRV